MSEFNENQIFDLIVIGTGTAASTTAHECCLYAINNKESLIFL
jgi:hypothetical protein